MGREPPDIDRRAAVRHRFEVPVHFEVGSGMTRDVSTRGVFFVTSVRLGTGQDLDLALELPGKGAPDLVVGGSGTVVRTEHMGKRCGVAVEVSDFGVAGSSGRTPWSQ